MKKIIFIACFVLFSFTGFAQKGYFFNAKKSSEKYLVSLGYGAGTAHWNSTFTSTEFYGKDGSVINSGDFKFVANSPTKNYDVNVMAPVKGIRIGLGINFEFHYLSQMKIYTKDGGDYLLFDEGLRFDKIYLQTEIPLYYDSDKKYSISWNMKLGWFGYTNMKRFNFLGEKPFPVSAMGCSGVVVDYEIYPRIYLFALPNLEYKLYDNSGQEGSVDIRHNVYSANILAGIRVDLGKFYN